MSKLGCVAGYEYSRHVLRRSFLFATLSLPLVVALIVGVTAVAKVVRPERPTSAGIVDQAGFLLEPPEPGARDTATVQWVEFPSEQEALAALEAQAVQAVFVLPGDYPDNSTVRLIAAEELRGEVYSQFRTLLRARLLAGRPDAVVRRAVEGSTVVTRLPDAVPGGAREFARGVGLGPFLPALAGLSVVILIFFSSGYLMGVVTDEKANRTMEILMTSVSSGQLMAGKLLGIVGVTFTQLAVWAVLAALFALVGGDVLGLAWLQGVRMDPGTFLIALAVLVPTYVLVAALMTALGAVLNAADAGQQVAGVIVILFASLLALVVPLLRNLDRPVAIALSLLPLTAPVVLPLQAAFTQLAPWQIGASIVVQVLCALAAVWLAGRALRIGMLRYGRRLSLRHLLVGTAAKPQPEARMGSRPQPRSEAAGAYRTAARRVGRAHTAHKALRILRYEFVTMVTKPLFVLVCVGVPLLLFVQMALSAAALGDQLTISSARVELAGGAGTQARPAPLPEGYLDPGGLIKAVPGDIAVGQLVTYPDEATARRALAAGEIAAFTIVPRDYLETGELICVRNDYNPLAPDQAPTLVEHVLLANLLHGDAALAARVQVPMQLEASTWTPAAEPASGREAAEAHDDGLLSMLVPSLVMLPIYGAVVMASGLVLRSVSEEKKNRVMEVLLLSASPRQMLSGKIVAMGVAGLVQALVWTVMGYIGFTWGGRRPQLPAGIVLGPSLLAWAIVFFLLGYAVYACLFAAAGALVPDYRQSPQASLLLLVPAFIGFEVSVITANSPHGPLATAVSLFPLTAPFSMMSRLVKGGVPPWQPPLAILLTAITVVLSVRTVARMFRAQNLLSGQPFSVKRYLVTLLGRA